ncbi:MAG: cobalamin biosynthesis protein CobW, partial [Firmicutes bacterium]|nr:cobalamin biosynthesis protein CobW [Bacillota bacterium]
MSTVINVVSGFLGAGKTTLIKKLLQDGLNGKKVVLIENEYGEIGIDGGFLKDSGVQITEMNSGCICCTLVGDFGRALQEVLEKYAPERILIEPSGVGKLSDVVKAVQNVAEKMEGVVVGGSVTVADVLKCKMYMKNFGEFYNNQIETAGTIVLSRTQKASEDKVEECVAMLREHNTAATIITTPWDELEGAKILETMQSGSSFEQQVIATMVFEDEDEDEDEDEHEHHHDHDHEDH